jgi:hypothetical protein
MPAFGLLGIDFGHGFDVFLGKLNRMDGNPFHYLTTILKNSITISNY